MCILHISINKIISYILYIFGVSLFMCISFISPVEHKLHESGEFFCFHCASPVSITVPGSEQTIKNFLIN